MQKLLNQITKCQGGENGKVSTKISIQFEISAVQAFNELKDNRISQVELVHPDYIVHPDLAIGAVLTQDNPSFDFEKAPNSSKSACQRSFIPLVITRLR